MELIQQRIKGAPPVYTARSDVGEQLGQAIVDLATAPKGGVFSCKWDRHDRSVYWGYVWREANGCRSALAGQILTHDKHTPLEWVEVENQDRQQGLPPSLAQYEARTDSAWCSEVYQTNAFEL